LIINAAKELHIQHPDLRWILVGDGRMRVELELFVKELGLDNIILFPGRVPATEVPKWIAWADATLLTLKKYPLFAVTIPSRLQTYMACGKPVLASIDGEAAQLIREADCGLAAPAEDTEAFVQVVQQFLNKSQEKQMQWGTQGRDYYLRNFERNYLIEKLHQQLSNATC
jgi:glycosyltransferase involved in cell wall biosynthesis